MWKRERMMVDVMTIQNTDVKTSNSLLQNRQYYPFQGLQDDTNNFFAGNEFTNSNSTKKRPLLTTNESTSTVKRQKQETILKTNYTFTSKPYDVMENLMYYY